MAVFKKASKEQAKLRAAFLGPAGSGKTYSALLVATGLGKRIAVIDTEHGSASKYADLFNFDTVAPESFSPDVYVDAIRTAEAGGYDVLIIDSLSHAWSGKDGILEYVDQRTKASKSGNAYSSGWRDATPKHNALVEAILACRCHVIATMRTKTEYVLEEDNKGRKVPRKVGMAPVQRDGVEYEFDVVGDLDLEANLIISKTRCPALCGKVIAKPGVELGKLLGQWLSDGVPASEPAPRVEAATEEPPKTSTGLTAKIKEAWEKAKSGGMTPARWAEVVTSALGEPKPSSTWSEEDFEKVKAVLVLA